MHTPRLNGVAEYVDEIIVVNNGSLDETRFVAESFGAKIIDCPYTNHDEGRNAYLEEASKEWVFVIDADERITSEGGTAIQLATSKASKNTMGFVVPRFEYTGHGKWSYLRILRIFRNHPQIRYTTHKVHSSPGPAALRLGELDAVYSPLHHLDILYQGRTGKKRERNVRRLLDELQSDSRSVRLHSFLGVEYIALGMWAEAENELVKAIELHPDNAPRSRLYLSQLYLLQDKLSDAEQVASSVLPLEIGFREQAPVILAEVAFRQGRLADAIEICKHSLHFNPALAHMHINIAALLENVDPKTALEHLTCAVNLNPYLLKPLIYQKGESPNIFQHQISFLSCTKNIHKHMQNCYQEIGDRNSLLAWKGAEEKISYTITQKNSLSLFEEHDRRQG